FRFWDLARFSGHDPKTSVSDVTLPCPALGRDGGRPARILIGTKRFGHIHLQGLTDRNAVSRNGQYLHQFAAATLYWFLLRRSVLSWYFSYPFRRAWRT